MGLVGPWGGEGGQLPAFLNPLAPKELGVLLLGDMVHHTGSVACLIQGTIMNTRKQPGHPRVDYQTCASWTKGFNAASWGFLNDFPGAEPITNPSLFPQSQKMLLTHEFSEGTYNPQT